MADAGAPESKSSARERSVDPRASDLEAPSRLRVRGRLLLALLFLLPKNALSRLAGRFAALRLPGPLQRAEIRLFARLTGVDLAEARAPVEAYESLQAFFTRALREGARPVQGDALSLVAPCDGAWGAAGRIDSGMLVQVKGRSYSVSDLLGDDELANIFEGGCFATFYLSPRDYHRFHTPAAGRFVRVDHCPGSLWPVNATGLEGIDRLFARNERLCAYLATEDDDWAHEPKIGAQSIALVAVGATMVGSVRLDFDALRTNRSGGRPTSHTLVGGSRHFDRGEEWGRFEFGSTIVMLTPPDRFEIDFQPVGRALILGEVIGRRRIPSPR
jgi:phosphatidylserine decarboxylase